MEKSPKNKNHCILILCGGTGPRLWPLSHASNPKQFLTFLGDTTLLKQTITRAQKITASANIFIISNKIYKEKINQIIKNLIPKENIILEPLKKNTAMAILYAVSVIEKKSPNAIITVLPSDHYIKNEKQYQKDIQFASYLATTLKSIVTLGIKPTSPNPSFGYILPNQKKQNFYTVKKFIEKPSPSIAQNLIKNICFWNSGIYTFTIPAILNEFKKYSPKYLKIYSNIQKLYSSAPELSIDKAISEKSKNLVVIPANFSWSDIGEWESIYQKLIKDKQGFAKINKETEFVSFNASNCLVSGPKNKLIGLIGVKDLAIIDTSDGLLVCNLKDSFYVRNLVSLIVKNKKTQHYFLNHK